MTHNKNTDTIHRDAIDGATEMFNWQNTDSYGRLLQR